ncbi:hypothetical protein DL96DRAFT_1609431 [Flagelloscypha sp. PMI_526]|nr:hypothetical protein DL96DRAFT_1609431 [Flagelloscypha sp. PMI_526]
MSTVPPLFLPVEIIQQVLSYIDDEELDTILAYSLVSWSFANACRSRRFGTIELGRNDVERQRYLAFHPHVTALTQCLVLFNNGYDETILPSILAALPNLVELRLYNFSPKREDSFFDNEDVHEALVKHVTPKVSRLELDSMYGWPLSALNDFTSLRSLSLVKGWCINESPSEEVVDPELFNGGLESISFRHGDLVEEANLTIIHQYLCSRNHKIKQVVWAVASITDFELSRRKSKLEFCKFFAVNSKTLTSLVVTTCLVDYSHHPWMLDNLPCLEDLTLPVVTVHHGQWHDEENITWIAGNLRNLRKPHPLRRFRLFVKSDASLSLEDVPWGLLDESLLGYYLGALLSVRFQAGSEIIDNDELWMVEEFGRAALPSCVKRGLMDAVITSCIW